MKSSQHHAQWIIAAGLVSGFMWWLGYNIVTAFHAGNAGFIDVAARIANAVSGQ
jgi:hypothetical protein